MEIYAKICGLLAILTCSTNVIMVLQVFQFLLKWNMPPCSHAQWQMPMENFTQGLMFP